MREVTASCSPSLALVKYWGKLPGLVNVASTPSLALTLDALRTTTVARFAPAPDRVSIDGVEQPIAPFEPLIAEFRRRAAGADRAVCVESSNSFPTAAGIASSSSGFAALTLALDALFATGLDRAELSAIARIGSGSACRAVYGGFTVWEAGSQAARPLLPATHWSDLRVLIAVVDEGPKAVASRAGMGHSRDTSPVYAAWVREAPAIFDRARAALESRDIDALGTAMRDSYLLMFSTMFTARPPFIYWKPATVAVLNAAEQLRRSGVPAWETMDAGPQVKIVTTADHEATVRDRLAAVAPDVRLLSSAVGGNPVVSVVDDRQGASGG
ncbi:MAG: diphosphomevalonate decarboxylase [Spirochaetaceae bacterium]|nr:MAG: diphosphomevalonate decarboxylase [Spirochaetaceae bacterium]